MTEKDGWQHLLAGGLAPREIAELDAEWQETLARITAEARGETFPNPISERLYEKMQGEFEGSLLGEKEHILIYGDGEYEKSEDGEREFFRPDWETYRDTIESKIRKYPNFEGIIYNAVNLEDLSVLEKYRPGARIEEWYFLTGSGNIPSKGNVRRRLKVKSAVSMSQLLGFPEDDEYLLGTKTRFKVERVIKGTGKNSPRVFIDLKEIDGRMRKPVRSFGRRRI